MESDSEEQLPQDRWYWGWYGIFLALLGISPFVPAIFGIPCGVIGIGGLLIQMREGFRARISRIRQVHISRAQLLAFMRIAAVAMLIILGIKTISLVFVINDAFDEYIAPRRVTTEQAYKLKDYLSKREAYSVSIKVIRHDQEAMEYASQLFFAMTQTNWDVDPPNHDGPGYLELQPYVKRPSRGDYKTDDDYSNAHDEWIESEIRRHTDENMYDDYGLCLQVGIAGQPVNPDPRHPTPDTVLRDAMQYAGIEVNCGGGATNQGKYTMYFIVGHRPRVIGYQEPTFRKIGRWLEGLGHEGLGS